jgi:hypothetical protein
MKIFSLRFVAPPDKFRQVFNKHTRVEFEIYVLHFKTYLVTLFQDYIQTAKNNFPSFSFSLVTPCCQLVSSQESSTMHFQLLKSFDFAYTYIKENRHSMNKYQKNQEPILRLLNLQLQRHRCSRLKRFSEWNKIFLFSK